MFSINLDCSDILQMSAVESISAERIGFLSASTRVTCRIALPVSTDDVLGSGPGVHGRQEQQLEQEMLRCGLSGQRQPPEVLLHQSV